jgi:hypothetical protein
MLLDALTRASFTGFPTAFLGLLLVGIALAAAGAPGLVRALELLEDEVRICLGLLGCASFAGLTPAHLTAAPAVGMPDIFSAFPHAAE